MPLDSGMVKNARSLRTFIVVKHDRYSNNLTPCFLLELTSRVQTNTSTSSSMCGVEGRVSDMVTPFEPATELTLPFYVFAHSFTMPEILALMSPQCGAT